MTSEVSCKNCGHKVSLHFCPNCGQKATTSRITLKQLISDLPHAIFHVDKGFLFNVDQLARRPGAAIEEYLHGKRKPFFHPVSFLVISLVLNYLVVKITNLHFYDASELTQMTPLEAKAIREYDAQQWWFLEHTYLYILIAIPVSTLFIHLILRARKNKFNLAESAVIVHFTIAEGVLLQSLVYFIFGWVKAGDFRRAMESFVLTMLTGYAAFVLYQLLTPALPRWGRIIYALVCGFTLLVLWIGSAYVLYYFFG